MCGFFSSFFFFFFCCFFPSVCVFLSLFDFFFSFYLAAEAPQTFNNNTGRWGERAGQSDGGQGQTPNAGTTEEGLKLGCHSWL